MAFWTAPSWTSIEWVSLSWRGSVSAAPEGNWLGDGWLRPGWTLSAWTTNDGAAPTSFFVSDQLNSELDEDPISPLPVKLSVGDALELAFTEVFFLTYKRHVVAFEALNLNLGEVKFSVRRNVLADSLDVELVEVVNNSQGDLVPLSVSDDLDVEVEDPGVNQFLEAGDTLGVGVSDSSSYFVSLLRADSLSLLLGEAYTKTFTGALALTVSDTLNTSFIEESSRNIFFPRTTGDTLDLQLGEEAVRVEGTVTVYLQQFDTLDVEVEGVVTVGGLDTSGFSVGDTLNLTLNESATLVFLIFFSTGDQLNLAVVDSRLLDKISVDVSWEDADYPWGGGSLRDIKPLPVFCQGFDFYAVDSADTFITGKAIDVLLERLGLTIYGRDRQGGWKEDPDVTKLVKAVYPLIRGEKGTTVYISVGAQDSLEEGVVWDGPHEFVLGRDTYVTPLIQGRYIAVRFESSGQKPWTLLSYDLDITKVGRGSF